MLKNLPFIFRRLSSGSCSLSYLLTSLLAAVIKVSAQVDIFDVADVLSDFVSNIFSLKKDVQDRKDLHLSLCYVLIVIIALLL